MYICEPEPGDDARTLIYARLSQLSIAEPDGFTNVCVVVCLNQKPDDTTALFYARLSQVNIADPDGDCTYA